MGTKFKFWDYKMILALIGVCFMWLFLGFLIGITYAIKQGCIL